MAIYGRTFDILVTDDAFMDRYPRTEYSTPDDISLEERASSEVVNAQYDHSSTMILATFMTEDGRKEWKEEITENALEDHIGHSLRRKEARNTITVNTN